ncbi:glycosyltransferase [Lactobacillus delbrueckii subsp. bulgaricus]|uniref:glycosyltransferase n=1 Tax=Lactobacillus delbrueckii TaxID=1584 RepID=UPI0038519E9E
MIFVTMGTHEQPFNRLIQKIDELKRDDVITEDVVIQTDFSTYEPKCYTWQKMIPFQDMGKYVKKTRIIITHGGPLPLIVPLQIGKIPIVMPRQSEFNEHVNNHQLLFTRTMKERYGNLIVVEDIKKLGEIIKNYDKLSAGMHGGEMNKNAKLCVKFEEMADELVGEEKK